MNSIVDGYEKLPERNSQEYLWWRTGAEDEARSYNEGLNAEVREVRDTLTAFAKLYPKYTKSDIVLVLARIYCPDKLMRKYRKAMLGSGENAIHRLRRSNTPLLAGLAGRNGVRYTRTGSTGRDR